ncbi:hypothetical protein PM082_000205 [Marasmius tenuissimus]|nr:hypothetical protein PM082_000205 [Marasmius tenuissimus]
MRFPEREEPGMGGMFHDFLLAQKMIEPLRRGTFIKRWPFLSSWFFAHSPTIPCRLKLTVCSKLEADPGIGMDLVEDVVEARGERNDPCLSLGPLRRQTFIQRYPPSFPHITFPRYLAVNNGYYFRYPSKWAVSMKIRIIHFTVLIGAVE